MTIRYSQIPRIALCAIATAGLLVEGCGGGSATDNAKRAAQTFMDALADGDATKGCAQLDKAGEFWLRLQATDPTSGIGVAGGDCVANFKTTTGRIDFSDLQTARITRLRVKGSAAFVVTDSHSLGHLTLTRHGSDWKVSDAGS